MITLKEVLLAVRDENLPLPMLEKYRDSLIHMKTDVAIEIAEKKKARAFFLMDSKEPTAAAKRMAWEVTPDGQRLIELEGYMRGIGGEIDALMSRIYSSIR